MTELINAFENCHTDQIKDFANTGCHVYTVVQEVNDILYIPPGWLVCTCVLEGPLVYGCRQAWLFESESHHDSYEALHGLWVHSGKKTDKMEVILECIRSA